MTKKDPDPKELQRAYDLIQSVRRSNEQGSTSTLEALQAVGWTEGVDVSIAALREALRQDWKIRFASQQLKATHRRAGETET